MMSRYFIIALTCSILAQTKVQSFVATTNLAFTNSQTNKKSGAFSYDTIRENTELRGALLLDLSILPNTFESASNAYAYALTNYQIETQSVSTGILSGVGDTLAQLTEKNRDTNGSDEEKKSLRDIKLQRTLGFMVKGLGAGIIWHFWYSFADSVTSLYLDPDQDMYVLQRTVTSILLEQFIACPIVYALWDIPVPALLNGTGLLSLPDRVREKLGGLLITNAKVWTFGNMILYNIPIEWRVLAMNFADLGWCVILSRILNSAVDEEKAQDEQSAPSKA